MVKSEAYSGAWERRPAKKRLAAGTLSPYVSRLMQDSSSKEQLCGGK
jgi:hypothetical protein